MSNDGQEKTFTQADLDALKAEHEKALSELSERYKFEIDRKVDAAIKKTQADAEEKARVANMSELEKAQKLADDYKIKFEAEADKNALTIQKDETRAWAREVIGVQKAVVKSADEGAGAGNVGVYITAIDATVSEDLIKSVHDYINEKQFINATVVVESLNYIPMDIWAQLTFDYF